MTKHVFKKHIEFPIRRAKTHKGVLAQLDRYFPNITDGINVDTLNMMCTDNCLLGQTIGWSNRTVMFTCSTGQEPVSFSNGRDKWIAAILQYRKEKENAKIVIDASRQTNEIKLMQQTLQDKQHEIEALQAALKAKLEEEKLVDLKLTKTEIKLLLDRKPAAVRHIIATQLREQGVKL